MSQTQFFHETDMDKFYQLLTNPTKEATDFYIVARDILMMTTEDGNDFVADPLSSNVYLAAFTTTHARLHLYQYLEMLDRRMLYYDTGKLIFYTTVNV